jgi:hypothetical protein
MLNFDIWLTINKKIKIASYIIFYSLFYLVGSCATYAGLMIENYFMYSFGLALTTVSYGIFFFIACEIGEKSRKVRNIFTIIGFVSLILINLSHIGIDLLGEHLELKTLLLRCDIDNVLRSGLPTFSYLYSLLVARTYKRNLLKDVGEGRKILTQILLPFVCYFINLGLLLIGLSSIVLILIILLLTWRPFRKDELIMFNDDIYELGRDFRTKNLYEQMKRKGKQKL